MKNGHAESFSRDAAEDARIVIIVPADRGIELPGKH